MNEGSLDPSLHRAIKHRASSCELPQSLPFQELALNTVLTIPSDAASGRFARNGVTVGHTVSHQSSHPSGGCKQIHREQEKTDLIDIGRPSSTNLYGRSRPA